MTKTVEFEIPFRIMPYQRLWPSCRGGVFQHTEYTEHMAHIRSLAEQAAHGLRFERFISVSAIFGYHGMQHADVDNLNKTIFDSLQPLTVRYKGQQRVGGLIADDRFILDQHSRIVLNTKQPERARILVATYEP